MRTPEPIRKFAGCRTPSPSPPAIAVHGRLLARRLLHCLRPPRASRGLTSRSIVSWGGATLSAVAAAAMSLVNLAHVCSHLQNASKARLGLTSIPVSKMHVHLALGLQREGFLSSVTLGGQAPPKPYQLQAQHSPEQKDKMARALAREPWLAYSANDPQRPPPPRMLKEHVHDVHVPENPARRRLWLGLKYWQNEPVLKNMKLISKPTRRIWLTSQDFAKITRTRESNYVKGLTHPGECMFVTTDRGILEARECVERQLGGMVLCRVW